jgi:tRNA-2-methylthio-N6-dimethylallyladenosine synthase
MREVGYEMAYMFKYSQRPGTYAADNLVDDIPEDVKSRRLTEIIDLQHALSAENKKKDIGKTFEVLVEAVSKKSKNEMYGRTSQNNIVVFPKNNLKPGDYVMIEITGCTQATLKGKAV